ncbi:MAG: DUF3422 family protein [Rhizomicrobium sp.]
MPFIQDDQYRVQNAGALQRPAPVMGAPGLIWHRALWKPEKVTEDVWHRSIDYYLFRLFMHMHYEAQTCGTLEKEFTAPNFDRSSSRLFAFRNHFVANTKFENWRTELQPFEKTPTHERFVRHNVFSIRALLHGLRFTVRATLHTEYWSLSIWCDFSDLSAENLKDAGPEALSIFNLYRSISKFVEKRFQSRWGGIVSKPGEEIPIPLSQARITLVDQFRALVATRILAVCETNFPKQDDLSLESVGGVFAEFFGNVFGVEIGPGELSSPIAPKLACVQVGDALVDRTFPQSIGDARFASRTALYSVDAFWPVIEELHRSQPEETLYGKPEFTVSLFQNSRSIYISALGRLNPDARAALQSDPVIYTIIPSYRTRWQLGRLVDRINTLGTLRLAALRDLQKLSDASEKMRELERKINSTTPVAASAYASELTHLGKAFEDGLMYRVERSRYYVAQYIELMRQLRSTRVEGYQQYEDFVKRKLFDTFDFIDRLGRRYVELRSEIQLLLDRSRTDKTVSLQTSMDDFLKRMTRQQVQTNSLLEYAEWFIAAPIAYYAGMGIHYVSILTSKPVAEGWGVLAGIVLYFMLVFGLRLFRRSAKV